MLSSIGAVWIGRGMSALVVVFLLAASVAPKLAVSKVASDTLTGLGWPARFTFTIGVIELACIVLYVVLRTSVLGAVLLTGLLGGAMATHLRVGSPLSRMCSLACTWVFLSGAGCGCMIPHFAPSSHFG